MATIEIATQSAFPKQLVKLVLVDAVQQYIMVDLKQ
jgi:hypothetical protein